MADLYDRFPEKGKDLYDRFPAKEDIATSSQVADAQVGPRIIDVSNDNLPLSVDPEIMQRTVDYISGKSEVLDHSSINPNIDIAQKKRMTDALMYSSMIGMTPEVALKSLDFLDSKVPPEQKKGMAEAHKAGLANSITGLVNNMAFTEYEPDDMLEALVMESSTFAADFPYMIEGGIFGTPLGGPYGAIGGAWAFPTALRKVITDKINKGEIKSLKEWATRTEDTVSEAMKTYAMGMVIRKVGLKTPPLVRSALKGKVNSEKVAKGIANLVGWNAEVGAIASLPALMEGRLPTASEFRSAYFMMTGLKVVGKVSSATTNGFDSYKKLQTEEFKRLYEMLPEKLKDETGAVGKDIKEIKKPQEKAKVKPRKKVYRTSKEKFDKNKIEDAVYFSPDKEWVTKWKKDQGYKHIEEFELKNDTNILRREDIPKEFLTNGKAMGVEYDLVTLESQVGLIKYAKEKGYDAIEVYNLEKTGFKSEQEIILWNSEKVLSQKPDTKPQEIKKPPEKPKVKVKKKSLVSEHGGVTVKGKFIPSKKPKTDTLEVKGNIEAMPVLNIFDKISGAYSVLSRLKVLDGIKPLLDTIQYRLPKERILTKEYVKKVGEQLPVSKEEAKAYKKSGTIPKSKQRMAEMLNEFEDAPKEYKGKKLSPIETEVFNWSRDVLKVNLVETNKTRKALDIPEIADNEAYFAHVLNEYGRDIVLGNEPPPKKFGKKQKGRIFNQTEFERKLGDELGDIFSKDYEFVMNKVLELHLKEQMLNPEQLRFNEWLTLNEKNFPESTIDFVKQYNKEALGQEKHIDMLVNNLWDKSMPQGMLKWAGIETNRFFIQKASGAVGQEITKSTMYGIPGVGGRPRQMIRNKFQFTHNFSFANPKAMAKSSLGRFSDTPDLKKALSENDYIKNYSGIEGIESNSKISDASMWQYKKIAKDNVKTAYRAAWHEYIENITNPKLKNLRGPNGEKWASDKRTYKEEKGYLFPEEIKTLNSVAEDAARATHYDYSTFGMPLLMQNKTLAAAVRLQSWAMNYQNMIRWGARRLTDGVTDQGLPLAKAQRSYALQYVVLGGSILAAAGYAGKSFLLGAMPENKGIVIEFGAAVVDYIGAETDKKRKHAGAIIKNSLQVMTRYKGAYDDLMLILNGDIAKLTTYQDQRVKFGIEKQKSSGGPSKQGTGKLGGGKVGTGKTY